MSEQVDEQVVSVREVIRAGGIMPAGTLRIDGAMDGRPTVLRYRSSSPASPPIVFNVLGSPTLELRPNEDSMALDSAGGRVTTFGPPWPSTPRQKYRQLTEAERRGRSPLEDGVVVVNDEPAVAAPAIIATIDRGALQTSASWRATPGFAPGTTIVISFWPMEAGR